MDSVHNEETRDPTAEGKSRQQFPGVGKLRVFRPDWGMMRGTHLQLRGKCRPPKDPNDDFPS